MKYFHKTYRIYEILIQIFYRKFRDKIKIRQNSVNHYQSHPKFKFSIILVQWTPKIWGKLPLDKWKWMVWHGLFLALTFLNKRYEIRLTPPPRLRKYFMKKRYLFNDGFPYDDLKFTLTYTGVVSVYMALVWCLILRCWLCRRQGWLWWVGGLGGTRRRLLPVTVTCSLHPLLSKASSCLSRVSTSSSKKYQIVPQSIEQYQLITSDRDLLPPPPSSKGPCPAEYQHHLQELNTAMIFWKMFRILPVLKLLFCTETVSKELENRVFELTPQFCW